MNNYFKIAIEAALSAGKAIMQVYQSDFTVSFKDDQSPLTAADREANAVINQFLQTTTIPIISEENKLIPFEVRKDWDLCWLVDPVDGTKEFIKRNGEFTVNIALISNQKPILGVIYVPVTKTLYAADVIHQNAYKISLKSHEVSFNEVRANWKPIQPTSLVSSLTIVGSRSHMNQETLDFIEGIKNKGEEVQIISVGSSLKFCLVAEGKANFYPRFAPTMEWDTAAAHIILQEAGGSVLEFDSGQPLRYNKENLLNPYFIAEGNSVN